MYRKKVYTVQKKRVHCTEKTCTLYKKNVYTVQKKVYHCTKKSVQGDLDFPYGPRWVNHTISRILRTFFAKMLPAAPGAPAAPPGGLGRLCRYQEALGESRARFTSAAA